MKQRKNIIIALLLVICVLTSFAIGIFLRINQAPPDTSVDATTYAGCNVYFTGQDLCEYGDCHLDQAERLMNYYFAPQGLTVTDGLGGGVNTALLESQDILIVGGFSASVDNELVNTISPYLAEAHDRHIMIVFDGNQFYVPNNFLMQYGIAGSGNVNLIGNGYVTPGSPDIRPQLLGQPTMCFTTPSGLIQTAGGSRVNEVDKYICNYQHAITGDCVWSEIKLKSGSSIHIMSTVGGISGHPNEQCGTDRTYIRDLHQRILNFACVAEAPPQCGNGTIQTGEQCDDGNTINGDSCSNLCQTTTQCNDGVDNDGDGRIDCSTGNSDPGCFPDGNGGGGACNPTDNTEQDTPAVCGNSTIELGETCDDGNTVGGDGCSVTCQTSTQCNDGIDNDGDGRVDCTTGNSDPGCFPDGAGGGGSCNPNDNTETDGAVCGNGVVNVGETCDDGNTVGGDSCSASCQTTTQCNDGVDNDGDGRIDCTTGNSDPGCFPDGAGGGGSCDPTDGNETDNAVCGNGTIQAGEQCDDGNTVNGDGCSASCQTTTQCNDGVDNDGDGRIDCQPGNSDPGCFPNGAGGGGACNPNDGSETNSTLPSTPVWDDARFLLLGIIFIIAGMIAFRKQLGREFMLNVFGQAGESYQKLTDELTFKVMPFEDQIEKRLRDKASRKK